jgi:KUP system potassium uptake protein
VPADERYVVNKVNAVQGFYATTYYLGFRDDFDVRVDEVIDRVCAIERRMNPKEAEVTCSLIRECAATSTHMCVIFHSYRVKSELTELFSVPHYHVSSRQGSWGSRPVTAVVNWTRSLLIDNIYRNLCKFYLIFLKRSRTKALFLQRRCSQKPKTGSAPPTKLYTLE